MRLRHIEVFHAIYSHGSVSNAAKYLNVSQPSVSKVLRHAEDQLGYPLFERTKGKLVPTDEAHMLFAEAREVYLQVDILKRKAANLKKGGAGYIRLAVMPALGLNILPIAIARFREDYPAVNFDIQTRHHADMAQSLYERENDIGLAFNPPSHVGLSEYKFGDGEFVCVYRKGELPDELKALKFKDLLGKKVIGIKDSGPLSDLLAAHMVQCGVQFDSAITVQTYYIAKSLAALGEGIAIIDELTAAADSSRVVCKRSFSPPLTYSVKGLYLESRPLPIICVKFLECIRDVYQEFLRKS